MDKVVSAVEFMYKKHQGQKDDCGKPYTEHIKQVIDILLKITVDKNIIIAACLHDTLEDTNTTYEEIKEKFGYKVADLVLEVTHEGEKNKGCYFPRLHSRDAILIKFADRLSNLSRMELWSKDRQKHYIEKSKFWKSEEE